jgi:hypothetical protein
MSFRKGGGSEGEFSPQQRSSRDNEAENCIWKISWHDFHGKVFPFPDGKSSLVINICGDDCRETFGGRRKSRWKLEQEIFHPFSEFFIIYHHTDTQTHTKLLSDFPLLNFCFWWKFKSRRGEKFDFFGGNVEEKPTDSR